VKPQALSEEGRLAAFLNLAGQQAFLLPGVFPIYAQTGPESLFEAQKKIVGGKL